MKNPLGSETFGTTNVRTDEFVLFAQVIVANGGTVEQADLEIKAIDDMLSLQKIENIINNQKFTKTGKLRKNQSMLDFMDGRLNLLINDLKQL